MCTIFALEGSICSWIIIGRKYRISCFFSSCISSLVLCRLPKCYGTYFHRKTAPCLSDSLSPGHRFMKDMSGRKYPLWKSNRRTKPLFLGFLIYMFMLFFSLIALAHLILLNPCYSWCISELHSPCEVGRSFELPV